MKEVNNPFAGEHRMKSKLTLASSGEILTQMQVHVPLGGR